jgi:hypothetical protein
MGKENENARPARPLAGVLLAAALLGLTGQGGIHVRLRGSREHCAGCGCQIPPGRAGRRCVACRGKDVR